MPLYEFASPRMKRGLTTDVLLGGKSAISLVIVFYALIQLLRCEWVWAAAVDDNIVMVGTNRLWCFDLDFSYFFLRNLAETVAIWSLARGER